MDFELRPKHIMTSTGKYLLPFIAFLILIISYSFYDLKNLEYIGLALILKHALDIFSVGLLVWIGAGVGRLILFHTRLLPDEPIDALLISIAVGFGIISNTILLLGLIAALHKFAIFCLFLILSGIAGHQSPYIISLIRDTFKNLKPPAENFALSVFCLALFSLGAIFLLVFAMAPPVDWDTLMYHLQIPLKFTQENRIYLPADNLHVAFIGLAHMLYIPFLEIGSISGPALLSSFMAILFGLSVFVLAYRLFNRHAAYISLAVLWGTSTILLVAITPRVDITLCFYLLLAQQALLAALCSDSKTRRKYFYLSAVLLGLSFSIKYSGLIYAVCLSPLIVYVAFKNSDGFLNLSKKTFVFGFIFLIIALPWLGKNWLLLEAPLFPYFDKSARFSKYAPPWIESLAESKPLKAKKSVRKFVKNKSARAPLNLRDFFFNPGKITIEGEGRYYYPNLLFFLLPLGVFTARRKQLAWLVLPAILFIGLIYMRFPRTNVRYLLPTIGPFTITVGFLVHWICQHIKPKMISIILTILLITTSLALTAKVASRYYDQTKAIKHAFGRISSAMYLEKYQIGGIRNLSLMLNFVNKNLPGDGVVLMLFDARGFYFRPETIQDIKKSNWPLLLNVMASDECLQRLNATHVLINQGSLNYLTSRGSRFSPTSLKALRRYTEQCLELVHETQAHRLYKIKNR